MTLEIGTRFTKTEQRPYTYQGERYVHTTVLRAEVAEVDEVGFTWRTVAVLHEAQCPPWGSISTSAGSMAWFGWDAALNAGRVTVEVPA